MALKVTFATAQAYNNMSESMGIRLEKGRSDGGRKWCCHTAAGSLQMRQGTPVITHSLLRHDSLSSGAKDAKAYNGNLIHSCLFDGFHPQLVEPLNGLVNRSLHATHDL